MKETIKQKIIQSAREQKLIWEKPFKFILENQKQKCVTLCGKLGGRRTSRKFGHFEHNFLNKTAHCSIYTVLYYTRRLLKFKKNENEKSGRFAMNEKCHAQFLPSSSFSFVFVAANNALLLIMESVARSVGYYQLGDPNRMEL